MKIRLTFLGRVFLFLLTLCAFVIVPAAFADTTITVAALAPPSWLGGLLLTLQGLPVVGPYLVIAFQWIAIVSAIFTVLSIAVQAIFSLPEVTARFAGAPALADKIKNVSDKIVYWLKFFSIRNAQTPIPAASVNALAKKS